MNEGDPITKRDILDPDGELTHGEKVLILGLKGDMLKVMLDFIESRRLSPEEELRANEEYLDQAGV